MSDPSVIRIMCPNLTCKRVLAVPVHARGKLVRCRTCGMNIRIPAAKIAPQQPLGPGSAQSQQAPQAPPSQEAA